MQVRPATESDLPAVSRLHAAAARAAGPAVYDEATVAYWGAERSPGEYPHDDPDHYFVVAEREGTVVGFGDLTADGEVHAVYVHPDHDDRGVGSALLANLEGYARARGDAALALESSLNAVGFYERAGYERRDAVTLEREHEGEPVALRVVRFRKEL